ncbi:hypothetical protein BACCAP_00222 [Pseudoflavonifractor capillosus ATCC 29799]|uniref:Uncharacterized protein n=1 Tax=Pseudoflavonifractor capillosus ATCC 29799 TaxID=411467 RepID=A6NPV5_9FIRM|nr:hypothetical protein BACCAP_00222 [Pseudoflavonifractor capillosus ATCC 29799]
MSSPLCQSPVVHWEIIFSIKRKNSAPEYPGRSVL